MKGSALVFISTLALGEATFLQAQGRLTGRVADKAGTTVATATIQLPELRLSANTDSAGRYTVYTIPAGSHVAIARAIGFRPETTTVTVRDSIATTADFTLERSVAELPGVVTTAARNPQLSGQGFYDRRELGIGTFIDRIELAKLEMGTLDRAFRNVSGVMLHRGFGNGAWAMTSRNQQAGANPRGALRGVAPLDSILTRSDIALGAGRGCYMDVYVNGALVYWMSEPPKPLFNLNDLHPGDVEAMEIYRSASQMPSRFNRTSSGCGALIIWLRSSRG